MHARLHLSPGDGLSLHGVDALDSPESLNDRRLPPESSPLERPEFPLRHTGLDLKVHARPTDHAIDLSRLLESVDVRGKDGLSCRKGLGSRPLAADLAADYREVDSGGNGGLKRFVVRVRVGVRRIGERELAKSFSPAMVSRRKDCRHAEKITESVCYTKPPVVASQNLHWVTTSSIWPAISPF